jgi:hypothetical protein
MINLPQPNKNETYLEFVDEEWNLWGGCNGNSQPLGRNALQSNHWEWLFKSINELEKDDICIFGGDFNIFGNGNNISSDDNYYYKTGFQGALSDAMERGAKVLLLVDRYYTGGVNGNGKSVSCDGRQTPWSYFGNDDCAKTGLYCGSQGWCAGELMGNYNFNPNVNFSAAHNAKVMKLNGKTQTYNFLAYDIPGQSSDITVH